MKNYMTNKDVENLSMKDTKLLYNKYVNPEQVNIFSAFDYNNEIFKRASGINIYTESGKKILDFTGGLGVLNHGHNHPRILKTRIKFQKEEQIEVNKLTLSPYIAALGHNISNLLDEKLNKSYFSNSGAEANEGAIKMAYASYKKKRRYILSADDSFHGKLIATGSITGSLKHYDFPKMENFEFFKYDDFESLKNTVDSLKTEDGNCDVYAIILEPFIAQRVFGFSEEFIKKTRALCDEQNIRLIFDEVYCGWGKTGNLFAFLRYNYYPDILTFSKSFGGGKSSISGFIATDKVFKDAYGSKKTALMHTSTYNGFGEECATAIEAIKILLDENLIDRASIIHKTLHKSLNNLKNKYPNVISGIRGLGCINGVTFNSPLDLFTKVSEIIPVDFISDKTEFIEKLTVGSIINHLYVEHNILTTVKLNPGDPMLSISPSLVTSDDDLEYFIDALDKTLSLGLTNLIFKFVKSNVYKLFK